MRTLDFVQHPSSPRNPYQGRRRRKAERVYFVRFPEWDYRRP